MYEIFMKKVEEALEGKPALYSPNSYNRYGGSEDGEPAVWISWATGGQSGGSCWDTGDSVYSSDDGELEPEFDDLDKILEIICPEVSFLQYKKILREVIKNNSYRDDDYYGNYTNIAQKYVLLKDLYNALNSRNLGDW